MTSRIGVPKVLTSRGFACDAVPVSELHRDDVEVLVQQALAIPIVLNECVLVTSESLRACRVPQPAGMGSIDLGSEDGRPSFVFLFGHTGMINSRAVKSNVWIPAVEPLEGESDEERGARLMQHYERVMKRLGPGGRPDPDTTPARPDED